MIERQLLSIQKALSEQGIAKDSTNQQQNFKYRGIDQLLNELSPLFVKHDVIIHPRLVSSDSVIFNTSNGKPFYRTTVSVEYEFVHAPIDGEKTSVKVQTKGEGADQMDKALAKAMSAAYKYMMIQQFAIPIVGNDDPDAHSLPDESDDPISAEKVASLKNKINEIDSLMPEGESLDASEWSLWLCSVKTLEEIPDSQFGRAGNALAAIQRKHEKARA
tara:strand:- start:1639 stop:2292 length:654 start_codon:yes stop_codon:yes gene_type:complete